MSLDHAALHSVLALRSNQRGLVRVNQAALAAELGVDRPAVSKTLKAMVAENRINRVGNDYHNPLYKVTPVDEWNRSSRER